MNIQSQLYVPRNYSLLTRTDNLSKIYLKALYQYGEMIDGDNNAENVASDMDSIIKSK